VSAARATASAALAATATALALSGCGLGLSSAPAAPAAPAPVAPGAHSATTATSPTAAAIDRTRITHELPTPARGADHVTGGWRTPAGAVSAFATTYVNWTAATVAARLLSLSRASIGQARTVTARAAAEVADDRELHEGGVANAGTVEAIAPLSGRADAYAVVTRERTTATRDGAYHGLEPAWHVSVATVTRLSDGLWVLSGWQPEN
jgi:hypothetical protein